MRTIQEIEAMDFSKMDRETVARIRRDLASAFYLTSHRETTSDGRNLKTLIGDQLTRAIDFLMKETA